MELEAHMLWGREDGDYAAGMWGVGRREGDPHRVTWMEKTMRLRVRIWGNLGVPRSLFCENHPETVAFLY